MAICKIDFGAGSCTHSALIVEASLTLGPRWPRPRGRTPSFHPRLGRRRMPVRSAATACRRRPRPCQMSLILLPPPSRTLIKGRQRAPRHACAIARGGCGARGARHGGGRPADPAPPRSTASMTPIERWCEEAGLANVMALCRPPESRVDGGGAGGVERGGGRAPAPLAAHPQPAQGHHGHHDPPHLAELDPPRLTRSSSHRPRRRSRARRRRPLQGLRPSNPNKPDDPSPPPPASKRAASGGGTKKQVEAREMGDLNMMMGGDAGRPRRAPSPGRRRCDGGGGGRARRGGLRAPRPRLRLLRRRRSPPARRRPRAGAEFSVGARWW